MKPGDHVEFRVADDVLWRDQIVITKGTIATANITEAHGAKWPSRGSALALTLHSVTAANGKEVPLRAAVSLKGGINQVAGARVGPNRWHARVRTLLCASRNSALAHHQGSQ